MREALIKLQSVLQQPELSPAFGREFTGDYVKGRYEEFEAKFGIFQQENYAEATYSLKLDFPLNIPIFLWDKCPVGDFAENNPGSYVVIRKREWLTKVKEMDEDVNKYLSRLSADAVKQEFEKLVPIARKLKTGEYTIDSAVAVSKQILVKQLVILLAILAGAGLFIYWFVFR